MVTAPAATRRTTFPYLPALDGLRGVLIIPVMLFHFSLTSGADNVLAAGTFLSPSLFFALSGFLITSLLLIEHEKTGGLDWRGFWRRRFRRLVPTSVVIIFACAVIGVIWPSVWHGLMPVSDVLAALLSVKNWQSIAVADSSQPFRLLGPLSTYWSLAVEEQFYLGLSIVIALAVRAKHMIRWLVAMLVAVGLFSIASLVLNNGSFVRELYGTDTRASEIVAGCLLAVAVHVYGWPKSRWWILAGWTALAGFVIAVMAIPENATWVAGGGLAAASIINVPLIAGAVVPGSLSRVLSFEPLVWLGKISYPIYLIHWPVGLLMSPEHMHMTGWPLIILRFAVSIGLSYAILRFIERPVRFDNMLSGRSALAAWGGAAALSVAFAALAMRGI